MKFLSTFFCVLLLNHPFVPQISAADGLIDAFTLPSSDLELSRHARPGNPFDKVGRKFGILGEEGGSFEAWAYPLKLFRNFEFSFFLGTSTRPLLARDLVEWIGVTPEATIITYTYQSFTVRAIYVTPVHEPAAFILLEVNSTEPMSIVCSFLPVLQPMWPAGLGGQYSRWNDQLKAYVMGEPTRKNHALLGSPMASSVSAPPAHMLADTPNEFRIDLPEPDKVRNKFIPIYMTGGKGVRDSVISTYRRIQENPEKYYRNNVAYYRDLRQRTLQVRTPDTRLNLALEWAKVAYDNLMIDNPDLGLGLVAGLHASRTSGRPGFGWYFGGDAYMNFLSFNSLGYYSAVRDALAFTQKWQRADGKMAHELSQAAGYINWWKDYPYGFIHADTTPFYIVAMNDYYQMTGDLAFIRSSWNFLQKAYQWCLSTDGNGDGLMDNQKAGLGASEYGELTDIETDVYLAAVWVKATENIQQLAGAVGKKNFAEKAGKDYQKALKAFREKFWYEEGQFYAYAFNAGGNHVAEISPWLSVGLMWNFGTPEGTIKSLKKLGSADMTTDWGVRLISSQSRFFNPVGYNYGAIWPFVTGWVNMAQFTHRFSLQAFQTLQSNAQHTFADQLGMMPEVMSGLFNVPLEESVSHQGFSSGGVVLPFVRGLLGLHGNAVDRTVEFSPQFPADWQEVTVEKYSLGQAVFNFSYQRTEDHLKCRISGQNTAGYTLGFGPMLGTGSQITAARVNSREFDYRLRESGQVTQVLLEIPITAETVDIEIKFKPTVEFLPIPLDSRTGDTNRMLKVISYELENGVVRLDVEGRAGGKLSASDYPPGIDLQSRGRQSGRGYPDDFYTGRSRRVFCPLSVTP